MAITISGFDPRYIPKKQSPAAEPPFRDDHVIHPGESRDFPIDLVYLWCDSADPAFQDSLARYCPGQNIKGERFYSSDELKYSLRSAERYAPWIRTIHLVTNGQIPKWLDTTNPKINLVRHEDIFPPDLLHFLPSFNSQAIESNIHRIQYLAEHFLYANDDMFFGRPVSPSDFFSRDGRIMADLRGGRVARGRRSGIFDSMLSASAVLLDRLFSSSSWTRGIHQIKPLKKSVLDWVQSNSPEEYRSVASPRTRTRGDLAFNCAVWPNAHLRRGQAVRGRFVHNYAAAWNVDRIKYTDVQPQLICINSASDGTSANVRAFLNWRFSGASSFEIKPKAPEILVRKHKLVALTCTGDRPEAFALCEKWMTRQRIQPDRWIVVDDGISPTPVSMGQDYMRRIRRETGHTLSLNLVEGLSRCDGCAVAFFEDDDWYSPEFLSTTLEKIGDKAIAGVVS